MTPADKHVTDQALRERAYEIWEQEGHPDGRADDHWEMARRELTETSASEPAPAKSAKAGTTKAKPKTKSATASTAKAKRKTKT